MLDYSALQPIGANGLLTVTWRNSSGEELPIDKDQPHVCNLLPLTVPHRFRRIVSLEKYPRVDYGDFSDTLLKIDGECGDLYLLDNLKQRPDGNGTADDLSSEFACKTVGAANQQLLMMMAGTGGRPCAKPLRANTGNQQRAQQPDTAAVNQGDYVAIEWDWRKDYKDNTGDKATQSVYDHLNRWTRPNQKLHLIPMVIPGGTIVWVRIKTARQARKAHKALTEDPNGVYVIRKPKFIDGPDIFVAKYRKFEPAG